ncbi:serine protease svh-1 [Lepeophtheirus salmonis]|uniref:serine protease svh-1 n=1 Tax=Lepeophtheirus salmonis TaxID=72036 RepID=UPI001AE92D41|nr:serine protease svh-1-like [Lepeophtheirus salmonis]
MRGEVLAFISFFSILHTSSAQDPFGFQEVIRKKPRFRLRGGPTPGVGFVQTDDIQSWSTVCLRENFGIDEANVLCRENGYGEAIHVGQSLHSAPFNLSKRFINLIKYSTLRSIKCRGSEKRLSDCTIIPIQGSYEECKNSIINVVCSTPKLTACEGNTTAAFRNRCYRVYYEEKSYKEAIKSCRSSIKDGNLIEVKDWAELNFITELLDPKFITTRVWTGGHLLRSEVEDDSPPFPFWYGSRAPITDYPDLEYPTEGNELGLALDPKEPPFMASIPWSFLDPKQTYPFVCYSKMINIGCLTDPTGSNYEGTASRTESGSSCIPWNAPGVPILFPGQESWNHNYCRNVGGEDDSPTCFIDSQVTDFCSIPLCDEKDALRFLDSGEETSICQTPEPYCGPEHFECEPGVCIFSRYVCDGMSDCQSGSDELNCMSYVEYFGKEEGFKLGHRDIDSRYYNVTLNECGRICIQSKHCSCLSFSYRDSSQECIIGTKVSGTYSYDAVLQESEWNYFTLKKAVEETGCHRFKRPAGTPIEGIRILKGDKIDIVEVKIHSTWGGICDDGFGQTEADVLCRQLGYLAGSIKHEIGLGNKEDPISLYDLKCFGNETSIADCDFKNHIVSPRPYCTGNERIGVKCRDDDRLDPSGTDMSNYKCPIGEWKCVAKEECIDSSYLCDGVEDCSDASDEVDACETSSEDLAERLEKETVRLSDEYFGVLEILREGRWSPLCDSDFKIPDAKVVCRMLGLNDGIYAKIHSEPIRSFETGNEPLWISLNSDKQCTGDEYSLAECKDPSRWSHMHQCSLSEEIKISCLKDGIKTTKLDPILPSPPFESASLLKDIQEELLYNSCGMVDNNIIGPEEGMSARIVGGSVTRYGQHPWQASIRVQTRNSSFHWCGAVIIGKRHLLTAGHCLKEFPMDAYLVRVGDHVMEIEEEAEAEYDIDEIIFHEHYNVGPYLNNDIALIKLKSEKGLEYSKYVSAICLPAPYFVYRNLEYITISGWGRTGQEIFGFLPKSHPLESGPIPRSLIAVSVPMIPKSRCKEKGIYGNSKLSVGMFCAGHLDGKGDTCQGDSGGPAVAEVDGKNYLFGITSWGYGCGQKNKPGVYTKVSNYIYWIHENLMKDQS